MALKIRPSTHHGGGTLSVPAPTILGLPDKFRSWRADQWEAVRLAAESRSRFVAQCAPTGFGKSLAYMANGVLEGEGEGGRTVILTSTKALQGQLGGDFREVSEDIRGQGAYPCVISEHGAMVDQGPCHWGYECRHRAHGCQYYDALSRARTAKVVVTNYACWLSLMNYTDEGLGPGVTVLICDEAHDAPGHLADFLSVELSRQELRQIEQKLGENRSQTAEMDWWKAVAGNMVSALDEELRGLRRQARYEGGETGRKFKEIQTLQRKMQMVASCDPSDWMCEWQERQVGIGMRARREYVPKFDCVDPRRYGEILWRGVGKVILYSATVRPKTMELLGVTNDEHEYKYEFYEYESTFPICSHPITWVPTIRMSHRSSEGDIRIWLGRVDSIIRSRTDRRGIIHTVSYKRARYILENSEYRHLMVGHDSDTTRETIERFKAGLGPPILVSPVLTTGFDFPAQECEYQIIGKLPFPDDSRGVEKVRSNLDRDRGPYQAVQTLVQMTGRGMRSETDQCEDFIIDDNISWVVGKYRHFFPKWWMKLYRRSQTIPEPLPKL